VPDAPAAEIIFREARALDERDWDAWLRLYREDAVFWVPAWRTQDELCDDPDREMSFLYHSSRIGLEERVARLRTGQSVVTMPWPRTGHLIGNVMPARQTGDSVDVTSAFQTTLYHPGTGGGHTLFGRYEHQLRRTDGTWLIARKKVILVNDRLPAVLEFFCL
jgi:benzoate/toluate 1,2-dioxygenase beta subunit